MTTATASTLLENFNEIQTGVTSADKTGSWSAGADYIGLLSLCIGKTTELMVLTATLKHYTDSGDAQSLANLVENLALLSATPYVYS